MDRRESASGIERKRASVSSGRPGCQLVELVPSIVYLKPRWRLSSRQAVAYLQKPVLSRLKRSIGFEHPGRGVAHRFQFEDVAGVGAAKRFLPVHGAPVLPVGDLLPRQDPVAGGPVADAAVERDAGVVIIGTEIAFADVADEDFRAGADFVGDPAEFELDGIVLRVLEERRCLRVSDGLVVVGRPVHLRPALDDDVADFAFDFEEDRAFGRGIEAVGSDAQFEAGECFAFLGQREIHHRRVQLQGGHDVLRDVALAVGVRDAERPDEFADRGDQPRMEDEFLLEPLDDEILGAFAAGALPGRPMSLKR